MPAIKTRTAITELGLKIKQTPTQQQAELCAKIREDIEDAQDKLAREIEKLLADMREVRVPKITARAPRGTLYAFEVENRGERIKISKPKS